MRHISSYAALVIFLFNQLASYMDRKESTVSHGFVLRNNRSLSVLPQQKRRHFSPEWMLRGNRRRPPRDIRCNGGSRGRKRQAFAAGKADPRRCSSGTVSRSASRGREPFTEPCQLAPLQHGDQAVLLSVAGKDAASLLGERLPVAPHSRPNVSS
jgi:hypothetical protein